MQAVKSVVGAADDSVALADADELVASEAAGDWVVVLGGCAQPARAKADAAASDIVLNRGFFTKDPPRRWNGHPDHSVARRATPSRKLDRYTPAIMRVTTPS